MLAKDFQEMILLSAPNVVGSVQEREGFLADPVVRPVQEPGLQGQVVGSYTLDSLLGQGGMGTVWLCRDEKLQRDVAIKQVGMFPGQSVTDSARALREAVQIDPGETGVPSTKGTLTE